MQRRNSGIIIDYNDEENAEDVIKQKSTNTHERRNRWNRQRIISHELGDKYLGKHEQKK